jgi:UDPglucose 6-dehydrogenase
MRIAVVGAGYVGLVTAAGFADHGNHVVCADIDEERIAALRAGRVPLHERCLDELIAENSAAKRIRFTTSVDEAVAGAKVVFVAVGTPAQADGSPDLGAVWAVARAVAERATGDVALVLKSTVPVGTNQRVRALVEDARVHVVSNPEFLKEGSAVDDFLRPDRVVIGCDPDDVWARRVMARLYAPLAEPDRVLWMDPASAELTKYVANTMLAMRVSFMNEVAGLCERVGADVHHVRRGVGSDARIGPHFLFAGPGYGGSCFPKDVRALVATGREQGLELKLAAATHEANERQKGVLLAKLARHFEGALGGRRVALWGAAFKAGTDDLREAPALHLVEGLLAAGAQVHLHDPVAGESVGARFEGRVAVFACEYEAARGADAVVLVTDWRQYASPDFERLASVVRRPLVIDGRNLWSGAELRELGFLYEGIGVAA